MNSLIPDGWAVSSIAEIADVNPARITPSCALDAPVNFVPMAAVTEEFGGIDLSAKRKFSEVQKGYTQFREGDVIVAKITPCMENGKLAIVPPLDSEVGYGSTEFHVLRAKCDVSPDWIAYFVAQNSFRRQAQRNMSGSAGQLRVPSKWLQDQTLPLAPPNEQTRITEKIDELFSDLDAGVAALDRARANLKRYRAAVLKAAVEGRLTASWRKAHPAAEPAGKLLARILVERRKKWEASYLAKFAKQGKPPPKDWKDKYPEPAKPDTANLPELPEGWCWALVDQLCEIGTGTTPSRGNARYWNNGTVPWVTSTAVNQHYVTEVRECVTEFALEETTLRIYPKHTLILALYGEGKTRGKVSELLIAATINQALAALQTSGASAQCRRYLKTFLLSNYESLRRNSAGGVQPNLNLGLVQKIAVPLPPLSEQVAIVDEVDAVFSTIDASAGSVAVGATRATRLRQSILKRAFEGKLVPQDPNDEPASVLLDRIRTARVGTPKAAVRRGCKPRGVAV